MKFRSVPTTGSTAGADLWMKVAELPAETKAKLEQQCSAEASSFDAAMACSALSGFYAKGIMGYPEDPSRSRELFDRMKMHHAKACNAGELKACSEMGQLNAIKLRSLPPRSASAAEWAPATIPWLARACEGGDALSCDLLADIFEVGRGVSPDPDRAKKARELERAAKASPKQAP